MGRRLAAAVHVTHPETHEPMILQPGDEPDEGLAEVITNPAAWEPDEDEGEDGEDGDGGDPDSGAQAEGETKPRSRARKPADE
ncbi:hypothetical protein [Streptomyces sp. NPDC017958]|uniref:hypothetical protein n=1 Tax=Streptomyces sp. NPDC017958 TaxID=3365021 RepID=UPI0037AEE2C5